MKITKLYIVILCTTFLNINVAAQKTEENADTTQNKDSAKLAKIESTLDKLSAIVAKSKNDKQTVGTLCLWKKQIPLYNKSGVTDELLDVDSVTISIIDGYINAVSVKVNSNYKNFTNDKAPITLKQKRFTKEDRLHNTLIKNKDEYIILTDVFDFPGDLKSFIPDDIDAVLTPLTPEKSCVSLTKSVDVNNILDARVYTDALSAFGKEPNGLIQTDLKFKHILNRTNWRDNGFIWLNYVKLNVTASKFDSKNSFVDSAAFSRTSLLQKSRVSAEGVLNLFTIWIEQKSLSKFYADFGGCINIGSVARSKDTVSVTSRNLFTEVGVNLKLSNNIGCELFGRVFWQTSKSTDSTLLGKKDIPQNDERRFFKIGGEIFWNPFQDPASRIYARLNYIFTNEKVDPKNDFLQVQLGYSVLLSKLLSK